MPPDHTTVNSRSVPIMEYRTTSKTDTGHTTTEPNASATASKEDADFHCFAKLPPELQGMIWKQSIPRIWAYEFEFTWTMYQGGEKVVALFKPSSYIKQDTQPHRTLLTTCWNSRSEVLASFVLLRVYTDVLHDDEDEGEFDDTGNGKGFKTATVPFDKEVGIFCITMPIQLENFDRIALSRLTDIAWGVLSASELDFFEWCDRYFSYSHGFHFCNLVRKVAFVVTMPDYDKMSGDDNFETWHGYTDSHFIMSSWGLLTRFEPLDKIYFTHSEVLATNIRLCPDFHIWLESVMMPNVCTCDNPWEQPDFDARLLDDINEFSYLRRRCAAELEAFSLDIGWDHLWKDDGSLRTPEELRTLEEMREMFMSCSEAGVIDTSEDHEQSDSDERSNGEEPSEDQEQETSTN